MRHRAVVLLAVLATGVSGPPMAARSTSSGDQSLPIQSISEEDFLAPLLADDSVWVRSLRETQGARRADLALARVLEQPELSATREDLGSAGTETEAVVTWRPPRPDHRRLDIERATSALSAADASLEGAVLELRLDLRRTYAQWAIATQKVEVLESEADILAQLVRRSEERARVGETSGLEARRIRLALREIGARVALARAELTTARGEIAALRPDLAGTDTPRPLAPALDPAPAQAPPKPPALVALEAELAAEEMALELAEKVAAMPEISLGWKRVEPEGTGPSLDGPVVGVAWPIPLQGRGRAERLEATSRRDALQARLELTRTRYQAELQSAETSYEDLRRAVSTAEEGLTDAEPAVAAARAAFRLGEGDLTSLLDTLRTATQAHLAYLELLSLALEHQRILERARGQALPSPTTTRTGDPDRDDP